MSELRLTQAALVLGKSASTLRRWVREGCPATAGGRGRGKGYRVDVDAVRDWRESTASPEQRKAVQLREFARIALDFFRRGRDLGELGHRVLGVSDTKAAALLALFVDYVARRHGYELNRPELEVLAAIGTDNARGVSDSVQGTERITGKDLTCR